MTMFSSENRTFISCGGGGYGGAIYGEGFVGVMSELRGIYGSEQEEEGEEEIGCVGSDLVVTDDIDHPPLMAEEESRTDSSLNESSSKDQRDGDGDGGGGDDDREWLQLSIGGSGVSNLHRPIKHDRRDLDHHHHRKDSGLIELELMPTSSSIDYNNNNNNNNSSSNTIIHSHSQLMRPEFRAPRPVMNFTGPNTVFNTPSSFFLQQQYYNSGFPPPSPSSSAYINPHQEFNWGFRPMNIPINSNFIASNSSSSSSPLMAASPGSYFARPVQFYGGMDTASGPGSGGDFRVIQPPKRPHSGIWFMLQASQNQEKEPFLPQISKSYLRIKDGRMTIRLVIKYLVNKLRLENESEIEITCRGQKLVPFLTLQHVRDNIWSSPRDFITLLPNSSTTHHIMVLHYARTASNS